MLSIDVDGHWGRILNLNELQIMWYSVRLDQDVGPHLTATTGFGL